MGFYPGATHLQNGLLTVDQALKAPTVIETQIAKIAEKDLVVDKIFAEGGEVSGGAVIFSPVTRAHLFAENDVSDRLPGDAYQKIWTTRPESELARVQDFGGTFDVSDEARKRNQSIDFDADVVVLANTITRKLNRRAIETLQAAVDSADVASIQAASWAGQFATGNPTFQTHPSELPSTVFADAFRLAGEDRLGVSFSTLLVTPEDHANLRICYGPSLPEVLADFGLTLVQSADMPAGQAFLVDPGKVGFTRYEETLTVKTWPDHEHRKTVVQGYCMPVMGVTTPGALTVIHTTDDGEG